MHLVGLKIGINRKCICGSTTLKYLVVLSKHNWKTLASSIDFSFQVSSRCVVSARLVRSKVQSKLLSNRMHTLSAYYELNLLWIWKPNAFNDSQGLSFGEFWSSWKWSLPIKIILDSIRLVKMISKYWVDEALETNRISLGHGLAPVQHNLLGWGCTTGSGSFGNGKTERLSKSFSSPPGRLCKPSLNCHQMCLTCSQNKLFPQNFESGQNVDYNKDWAAYVEPYQ